MVVIMLAGVMFPLWPVKLRIGVWYLSVGALGLVGGFIGLAVIRLILWVGTSLGMKKAIWLFPNLFEDVGFVSGYKEISPVRLKF
jgi:translocation protein SEC62